MAQNTLKFSHVISSDVNPYLKDDFRCLAVILLIEIVITSVIMACALSIQEEKSAFAHLIL